MNLLMHTCCAPCSIYCIDSLRNEGIEPVAYWFNPNIHPYIEYKTRRDTLIEYSKLINLKLIINENYGLKEFCKNVVNDLDNRCINYCYRVRLEETAKFAKENGYDAFTSTLFVSPYQKHEELKKVCEEMAKKYNVEFLYRDFRPGFREGQAKARELGLYMQKYCGCVFSDWSSNYDYILSDEKLAQIHNKETERKIRLNWAVEGLDIRPYKNGNQEEREFIYSLKSKEYIQENLTDEDKRKIFDRFMKENGKNIQIIFIKDNMVGFHNGENICLIPEFKDKGIENAVREESKYKN